MTQQNILPPSDGEELKVENKLILLYLINRMDIPLSSNQIAQFCLESGYMNYYTFQQYLVELTEGGFIEKDTDSGATRYSITDEGVRTLELFGGHVSQGAKNVLNKYVTENKKAAKQELQCTANYFYDHNSKEYTVKCVVYEDELLLIEINLSVVSKEQALNICANWRADNMNLYGRILDILSNKGQIRKEE